MLTIKIICSTISFTINYLRKLAYTDSYYQSLSPVMETPLPPPIVQEVTTYGDYSKYGLLTMATLWAVETILPSLGTY